MRCGRRHQLGRLQMPATRDCDCVHCCGGHEQTIHCPPQCAARALCRRTLMGMHHRSSLAHTFSVVSSWIGADMGQACAASWNSRVVHMPLGGDALPAGRDSISSCCRAADCACVSLHHWLACMQAPLRSKAHAYELVQVSV